MDNVEGEKEILTTRMVSMDLWGDLNRMDNRYGGQIYSHPIIIREIEEGIKMSKKLIPERFHFYIKSDIRRNPGYDNMDINKYFAIDFYLEFL